MYSIVLRYILDKTTQFHDLVLNVHKYRWPSKNERSLDSQRVPHSKPLLVMEYIWRAITYIFENKIN